MGESMRKQKIKKILSLLAAGVLLLMSMSGCGKEAETGKTQVAMIVKSTESAFFKSVFAGARAAAPVLRSRPALRSTQGPRSPARRRARAGTNTIE